MPETKQKNAEGAAQVVALTSPAEETVAPVPELIVELRRPFMFEGEEITQVDLSNLAKLKAQDALEIDDIIMRRSDAGAGTITLTHPAYMYLLAHKASGRPIEFFQMMPLRLMDQVQTVINDYIQSRDNASYMPDFVARLRDGLELNGQRTMDLDLNDMEFGITSLDSREAERYALRIPGAKRFQRAGTIRMHQGYQFWLAAKTLKIPPARLNALSYRDAIIVRAVVTVFLGDSD